jgi:hypothetical protein
MPEKRYECEECGRTFKTEEACEVHEEHCEGREHEEDRGERSSGRGGLALLILITIIILSWGFIGGAVAQDVGITCDTGIGDNFCWIWHKNVVGQVAEGINNFFGG